MQTMSLVMANTEGALAKISKLLADADVNISDIDAEELDSCGVMRVSVSDEDFRKVHYLLRDNGYQVMPQEVLLVRVDDKPGGLAKLAVRLAEAKVNVRSMRIVKREDGLSLCAIVPEPFDVARAMLQDCVVES